MLSSASVSFDRYAELDSPATWSRIALTVDVKLGNYQ